MPQKKELEELNKQSVQKLEDYVKAKSHVLKKQDHESLHQAKQEWQTAWSKLMDALIVLEHLEI